ncbi:unnamed protein product [Kuraishia capsulata CBS 1993]|uniref:Anaphase-promoting complex subunit 3 n=1 Tax=Kuraishia capsulata CBS 1993 TaxID=1382522 RepID=W6MNH7_9ASCO|nr:uncharacterized protein KUCA_T00003812001 [Kuraishia capsulata CBS 1993]CDK27833.1 unnamed protein product [Kuraishia capsulata CBS 1993]
MNATEYSIQKLRSVIFYSLDNDLLPTAEFTAERLVAQDSYDMDSTHLYALVLFRRRRFKAAYNATANMPHIGCAYVFAKCAVELGLENEGLQALQRRMATYTQESKPERNYELERDILPDAVAIHILMGKLYFLLGDTKQSTLSYTAALQLNPYAFEAYEELCKMGTKVRVKSIFHAEAGSLLDADIFKSSPTDEGSKLFDPSSTPRVLATPEQPGKFMTTPRLKQPVFPAAPTRRAARSSTLDNFKQPTLPTDSIHRRSMRGSSSITSRLLSHPLNSLSSSSPAFNNKKEVSGLKRSIGASFSGGSASSTGSSATIQLNKGAEQSLLLLYQRFAKGLKAMHSYDCFKAIRIFDSLPENEKNSPWVLAKLARLHYEIVNYEESAVYFKRLRKMDRTRVEDMDYYSTLLWYLRKETDLSFLAHELYDIDKNSPVSWVAIGNLFSLTREPDEAIKCFQKATQIDASFAYAHTLQGHEYLQNDAFENALKCFRNALLVDKRHYNAFYGIGMVHMKLGEYTKAEFHFLKALEITPVNVILICCVGMVLERLGKKELALKQYIFASKLQPRSNLALFKKAQALFSLHQYDLALGEFERLQELTPDEASVHFLLGKLYRIAGRKYDSLRQFTIALNLDPKGSHLIREALESLQKDDKDDEVVLE